MELLIVRLLTAKFLELAKYEGPDMAMARREETRIDHDGIAKHTCTSGQPDRPATQYLPNYIQTTESSEFA